MLKFALLVSGMLIASPLLAQSQATLPKPASPAQVTTQVTPADSQAAPADPAQAAPATPDAMTTHTDPGKPMDVTQAAPAQQATQPAATGQQVAQVVKSEFASYDKDSNGSLNEQEFDAWMVALKTASDPATKADAPATKTWMTQAFAQADVDKDKMVSKAELTGFLSTGQG